jgi:hypothetical protein
MIDYSALAAEFLRALRGRRSQTAFSRRLGYKSNVAYLWEHERAAPTAAKALWAAERVGIDVREALRQFYKSEPDWLKTIEPATRQGVSALLSDLKGQRRVNELSARTSRNRFAVARWLGGDAEPSLPEFFMMIEAASLRLIDFVEQFVSPNQLPSIKERWAQLRVARNLAYDAPWTQAVLRALETESYAALPKHRPGWIARKIGISREEERRCLELLVEGGQIESTAERYAVRDMLTLDTRGAPRKARRLRGWWAREGIRRAEAGHRGLMYNLFSVSEKDLARLRELQKDYLSQVRSIVAQSDPVDHVVLAVDLLMDLDPRK